MTDSTLPAPLVPHDVDLRDFGFMPLHVQRLRDSDLAAISTGDEFKAAVLLWAFAWHQVPAASLPNDDRVLAARSGANDKWKRVKARALDGFVLCDDGRLYHPVICEAALDAWERRDEFQAKQTHKESRQERWRAELARLSDLLRKAGVTPPQRPTKAALLSLCRQHVDGFVDADVDAGETRLDAGEVAKTGTETETERKDKGARPDATTLRALAEGLTEPEDPTVGAGNRYGLAARAMRQKGCAANPGDPRLRQLVDQGASLEEFEAVGAEAADKGKGPAWALTALINRRKDAAEIRLAPCATAPPWHDSKDRVSTRGQQLGIGAWPDVENAAVRLGVAPNYAAYRTKVIAADAAAGGSR